MEKIGDYRGREQALVKHRLLETYLERLFMIIGLSQATICYVDCFAGPWEESRDDLMDTSIGISLNIMQKCRDALNTRGIKVQFRALYVEKRKRAFKKLQSFLVAQGEEGISASALKGDFYDLRQDILDWCGARDFVFFFIDPKGWKRVIEIPTLRPLLLRKNSELLINFMYDFVLRTHGQTEFATDMEAIFGQVPDTNGLSSKSRERHLINLYRENLKSHLKSGAGKPRSAYVSVLSPDRDRTKYHLVYLTRHAKGVEVFMDASEKLDLVQRQLRILTKQQRRIEKTKQEELFSDSELSQGEVCTDLTEAKLFWLKILSEQAKPFGVDEFADMLEATNYFPSDLQRAFGELLEERKVENLDMKRRRSKRFVHFDKCESIRKLVS